MSYGPFPAWWDQFSREELAAYYEKGEPLFSRQVLQDIDRQLDEHPSWAKVTNLNGSVCKYSLDANANQPEYIADHHGICYKFPHSQPLLIYYRSYQDLLFIGGEYSRRIYFKQMLRPVMGTSLGDIVTDYKRPQQAWLSSKIRSVVERYLKSASVPQIEKVVCFALGSLQYVEEQFEEGKDVYGSPRSHTQHLLALTVTSAARERFGLSSVRVVAQEPMYSKADEQFLQTIGIEVVRDPKGFLEITNSTLVLSLRPSSCILQIIADICHPAALICATISPTLEAAIEERSADIERRSRREKVRVMHGECYTPHADTGSSRVRDMIKHYEAWPFPGDENFIAEEGGMTLYTRKQ